jgi:predicted NAD/FAD-binding protein
MTHLGQPLVKNGQTLVKKPLKPLLPSLSSRTFAAFSKLHLNTSNSPNIKVVQYAKGHNFHIEWHLRFEVKMCEKIWSTPLVTIHRRPKNRNVCLQIVHKWLRKPHTPFVEAVEG